MTDSERSSASEEQRFVTTEQIRLFYRASSRTPYALYILLVVLAQFCAPYVPSPWPYLWAIAIAIIYGIRGYLTRRAVTLQLDDEELRRHCRLTLALTTAAAISAGSGILAFFPMLPAAMQAMITMLCIGWIAGAVGISSVYPKFFFGYVTPFGGCLLAAWLLFGYEYRWLTVFLLLILIGYLWRTTREIGEKTEESIRIRFANVDLLKALEARQRETEEASQAKSRFMAAASHDLRQPLMSLNLIFARLLRAADHPEAMAVASKLNTPIQALESILDSLVEISRLDAGAVVPHHDTVDLTSFARGLEEEFAPRAASSGLAWRVHAEAGLAVFDSHLAARVLRNLVDNAFKFTTTGSIAVTIQREGDRGLHFAVSDTGCGIPPTHIERIFDEYYQVENPHRARAHGLGLGLAIVKRLVHVLGGSIGVRSIQGRGTTFDVSIPIGASSVSDAGTMADASAGSPPRVAPALRLLFVEDDPDLQEAISLWSGGSGTRVLFAGEAAEALTIAGPLLDEIDVVVSDYRLPGAMNGLELVRALRQARPNLPAILLTGDAAAALAEQAKRDSIGFLAKPVSGERLESEIRRVIANSETLRSEVRDVQAE